MNRRTFLKNTTILSSSGLFFPGLSMNTITNLEVKQLTTGPNHHWFGYYDKLQMNSTGQYVLGMEVDF